MNKDSFKAWRDYLESILIAIFLALLVRTFIISGYKVPTSSMAPTLLPGDFIFSYKIPYGVRVPLWNKKIFVSPPKRGDVVVFSYPDQPRVKYVKRVVGEPGDRIEIKNGSLVLNDSTAQYLVTEGPVQEDFGISSLFEIVDEGSVFGNHLIIRKKDSGKSFGPIVVPPNEVFLLGDNRDSSDDSRYWGTVPIERIEGRVLLIWLSLDWHNKLLSDYFPAIRWNRVLKPL
jgi:signal peptidase I